MRLRLPRCVAPSIVLLALLTWAGCADEEPLTGPDRESAATTGPLLQNVTCEPLISEPVVVEICDLGSALEGESRAVAVNDNGAIALEIRTDITHSYLWTEAAGAEPIAFGEFPATRPEAINNGGDIVGFGFTGGFFGFRWTRSTDVTETLAPPDAGWSTTFAHSINDRGLVVGQSDSPSGTRAVFWSPGATTASAFSVAEGIMTAADVNESDVVAGNIENIDGVQAALFCCGAGPDVTVLGRLEGDDESTAFGINDASPLQVVGQSIGNGGLTTRPFIWEASGDGALPTSGTLSPLPLPAGGQASAEDINDSGYAVGEGLAESGAPRAMLWTPEPQVVDLGGPAGFEESVALGINESGWVVGFGTMAGDDEGVSRAILWKVTIQAPPPPPPPPPTLDELFEMLHAEIQALIDSRTLNRGQGRSLDVKVIQAERRLDHGQAHGALRMLRVFRWHVHVFARVGILTLEQAGPLRDLSGAIIETIQSDLRVNG